MSIPDRPTRKSSPSDPLAMLTALGFGPDTVLMNDPKLFVDGRFLASLLVELEDELGPRSAGVALFQIGLLHGLRDAARCCRRHGQDEPTKASAPSADTTALVMSWDAGMRRDPGGAFALSGHWPECHEAAARSSRRGLAQAPSCWLSAGYTTGWLSGMLDRSLVARETECAAVGGHRCRFEVLDAASPAARDDAELAWLLSQVPFDAFRKLAIRPPIDRRDAPIGAVLGGDGRFDRSQPVVHIWGPVMVLPFTTLEEALGTVDMLSRDPGIGEIRSVVVDLREQPLDEGFGAAALEQVLETIESWNAQSLVTGISHGSEAAIASLESSHLIVRKDLSAAIATAFQIADAQRHAL